MGISDVMSNIVPKWTHDVTIWIKQDNGKVAPMMDKARVISKDGEHHYVMKLKRTKETIKPIAYEYIMDGINGRQCINLYSPNRGEYFACKFRTEDQMAPDERAKIEIVCDDNKYFLMLSMREDAMRYSPLKGFIEKYMPLIAMGIIFIMIIYLFQGTTAYMQGITSQTVGMQTKITEQNGQIINLLNKQLGIVSPAAAVTTPPPGVSAPINP